MTDITIFALALLIIGFLLIIIGIVGVYKKRNKSNQPEPKSQQSKTPVDPSIVEKIRNDDSFKKQIKEIIDKQKDRE